MSIQAPIRSAPTPGPTIEPFRLDVHVAAGAAGADLAADARAGLTADPKALPPKYFYDAHGSELFERITLLPEYYQTRTEDRILAAVGPELAALHRPTELVELGSGSSRKTERLIAAMRATGLTRYVPFDVSPEMLLSAAGRVARAFPGLWVHAVAGDFGRHLDEIPRDTQRRRMVAFLGGTVGNLHPSERHAFMRRVAELLGPGDLFLMGTDLAGDLDRIHAAYNDAAGVTAEFNLNVLSVLNRELGADFDLARFSHVARYCPDAGWVEMALRSEVDQTVRLTALDLTVEFAAGEEMRTELSCKFTRAEVESLYRSVGLEPAGWYTDADERFAVSVARRPE